MPEPIEITLTPAELAAAAKLGITPDDALAHKRVELARTGGLEDGIPRADYEAIDALHRANRPGVTLEDWRQATGRDEVGRKLQTGDQA